VKGRIAGSDIAGFSLNVPVGVNEVLILLAVLRRRMIQMASTIMMNATPPTTPPAIAPMGGECPCTAGTNETVALELADEAVAEVLETVE
jgi:hypothetical protein